MKRLTLIVTALTLYLPTQSYAAPSLSDLQQRWSVCQYQTLEKQKIACFTTLSEQAHQVSAVQGKEQANLLIWSAIIDSSWAGAKGGLGALSLVKQARDSLEKAIRLDPSALQGSAWTSLGALYYQVPGWPIAFGDNDKADEMLKKALAINPEGIDPNYFYGDFQLKQGNKTLAKTYLEKALQAPDRPGREIADSGRRRDIQHDLAQLQ
ncbi:tetratricopeptide repeat protein [Erwinia sp. AnSW2-5]|uniref:tetratricopeptide repeat protein n=1 Tax=Erwinia sp. AnSW2-5 TaxID=3367692 RepID=UPI003858B562